MATFQEMSKEIFRAYVRSALIIDDQWPEREVVEGDSETGELDLLPEQTDEAELDVYETDLAAEGRVPPIPSNKDEIDAAMLGELRRALMLEGVLTCGLRYRQTDRGIAIELAKRADMVVLDWHLVNDEGDEAIKVLGPLLGECLRFVCIWTGQGKVSQVKERLIQEFVPEPCRGSLGESGQADFRLKNLVFAIRIKEGLELDSEYSVKPGNLLGVAVQGLANSFGGLVQLSMLEMTNRHREHLPEILVNIGSSIDGAVLCEAGHKDSPVRQGSALLNVLVDEWRSLLERDSSQFKSLSNEGRRAFGAKLRSGRNDTWKERMTNFLVNHGISGQGVRGATAESFVAEIDCWLDGGCEKGLPGIDGVSAPLLAWAVVFSATNNDSAAEPLLRLDALFHQQFSLAVSLTQGTVVEIQKGDAVDYLICMTPLCDVARPEEGGGLFTFVRARAVGAEEILKANGANNYCVVGKPGRWRCLSIFVKQRVSLDIGEPRFDSKGVVRARPSIGDRGIALGIDDYTIELRHVAQLRLEHALELSTTAAADASRVGVNRVELIRSRIRRKN
jgi:hypothetical protein